MTTEQAPAGAPAAILIAAGSTEDRSALESLLRDAGGFEIVNADNPEDARAILARRTFDAVLLDVMQPRSAVSAIIDACTKREPQAAIPVLVVAPDEALDRAALCIKWGADDYVSVPFNKTLVTTRIHACIERRRLARDLGRLRSRLTQKLDTEMLRSYSEASGRFVPKEFLDHLDRKSLLDVRLGDHVQRDMTVFFADIRDFTALSEQLSPQENFRFLNSYLQHVNPIIRRCGGFIDKYMGDAIMALFPNDPLNAVQAGVDLLLRVRDYNHGRRSAGYQPIGIGIGIHRGDLILGTIGEDERMQTTVISDAVNVASRLEGLTKTFGVQLMVSSPVLEGTSKPGNYKMRHLGAVKAKGKRRHIEIYECFNTDPPDLIEHKEATAALFAEALAAFQKGTFLTAGKYFQRVAAVHPGDGPAAYYRDRCTLLAMRGPRSGRWDGADFIESK